MPFISNTKTANSLLKCAGSNIWKYASVIEWTTILQHKLLVNVSLTSGNKQYENTDVQSVLSTDF